MSTIPLKTIDPYSRIELLYQALSADKARIGILIGAGCSTSIRIDGKPLIPNIEGVTNLVQEQVSAEGSSQKEAYDKILAKITAQGTPRVNIENILTFIRLLKEVSTELEGEDIKRSQLDSLETRICDEISLVVKRNLPSKDSPHHKLSRWIGGISRAFPVEIFTPNYDLLIEQALEEERIPYFDGFIGSRQAFFDLASMEQEKLPTRWARLWKLHGSVNWWKTEKGATRSVAKPSESSPQMIFPSHLKYDQSRKLPYLAMIDRLINFHTRDNSPSTLIVNGYSCADDHLNNAIIQGLSGNARSTCFCIVFGTLAQNTKAIEFAKSRANIILLAEDGCIMNCEEYVWASTSKPDNPFHGKFIDAKTTAGHDSLFITLGDFVSFGEFLSDLFLASRDRPREA